MFNCTYEASPTLRVLHLIRERSSKQLRSGVVWDFVFLSQTKRSATPTQPPLRAETERITLQHAAIIFLRTSRDAIRGAAQQRTPACKHIFALCLNDQYFLCTLVALPNQFVWLTRIVVSVFGLGGGTLRSALGRRQPARNGPSTSGRSLTFGPGTEKRMVFER
jgi:hypothetical protein